MIRLAVSEAIMAALGIPFGLVAGWISVAIDRLQRR